MPDETPAYREDGIAYPIALAVVGCLLAEFEASGLPAPANAGVAPGGQAVFEGFGENCEGMAWTRLANEFPTSNFPIQDNTVKGSGYQDAFVLEVGMVACATTLPEDDSVLMLTDMLDEARNQYAYKAAMRRAICACLKTAKRSFVLGAYTPYGPQGGVTGGSWSVTISGVEDD